MPITSQGGEAALLKSGEAERLRSKQPEVAVTDGRDALRRVRLCNGDTLVVRYANGSVVRWLD